jgi:zinc/manganese transport system permease protein
MSPDGHGLGAWLAEPLQYRFVCRGLGIALLLGVTGGIAGCVLLLRRMALMADSFGHSILPGVGLAYLFLGPGLASLFAGAATAGLLTALMSGLVSRLTRLKEDAAFGAFFVLCFAVGIAIMSRVAAPADLLHYLFGNVLAVTSADLLLAAAAASVTVIATAVFYRVLVLETFDPSFHRACGGASAFVHLAILGVTVLDLVAALQAVGVVLALGLFILPAATAYLWCDRLARMLLFAACYGAIGSVLGLYASYHLNLPSGPCMVGCLGIGFLVSTVASPNGVIARLVHSRRHLTEDDAQECEIPAAPAHAEPHRHHDHDHHGHQHH